MGNYLCGRCGVAFMWPQMSKAELASYYNTAYRREQGDVWKLDLRLMLRQRERFKQLTKALATVQPTTGPVFTKERRVVEIGGYSGEVLVGIRETTGCPVVGLEIDQRILPYAKHVNELDMRPIPDIVGIADAVRGEQFDVLLMIHSLEHIDDLRTFLGSIVPGILRPGGLFVIEVPNFLGTPSYDLAHCYHFCAESLREILGCFGFALLASVDARQLRGVRMGNLYAVAKHTGVRKEPAADVETILARRRRYARAARVHHGALAIRRRLEHGSGNL